jgi:hypothetical protein
VCDLVDEGQTMGMSLPEALKGVDLKEGQTYRCQVNGLLVEVRVLGPAPQQGMVPQPATPGTSISDTMLDVFVDLPKPPLIPRRGGAQPPKRLEDTDLSVKKMEA